MGYGMFVSEYNENWTGKQAGRKLSAAQQYADAASTLYTPMAVGPGEQSRYLLTPEKVGHQSLYMLATGKKVHFSEPSTEDYKFSIGKAGIVSCGTILDLLTSANAVSNETWDVRSEKPLYAALHHNPIICKQMQRNVYWEYDLRLSDAVKGAIGIGYRVPDREYLESKPVRYNNIHSFSDAMPQLSPCSVFWWSADNSVWINGTKVENFSLPVGQNSTLGIGLILHYDGTFVPEAAKEEHKKNKLAAWIESKQRQEAPVGELHDLYPVATEIFFTVDGVMHKLPQEASPLWKAFINGVFDIYPAIVVSGAGVEGSAKFGQAVEWDGEGGFSEAAYWSQGDRNLPGYKQPKWPFSVDSWAGWWAI